MRPKINWRSPKTWAVIVGLNVLLSPTFWALIIATFHSIGHARPGERDYITWTPAVFVQRAVPIVCGHVVRTPFRSVRIVCTTQEP